MTKGDMQQRNDPRIMNLCSATVANDRKPSAPPARMFESSCASRSIPDHQRIHTRTHLHTHTNPPAPCVNTYPHTHIPHTKCQISHTTHHKRMHASSKPANQTKPPRSPRLAPHAHMHTRPDAARSRTNLVRRRGRGSHAAGFHASTTNAHVRGPRACVRVDCVRCERRAAGRRETSDVM